MTAKSESQDASVEGLASALSGLAAFRQLLEAGPDPIVIVDDRGRMVLLNRQAELTFGYSRRDLLGKSIELLVPAQFRDLHVAQRAQFQAAPRVRPMGTGLQLSARRCDGSEFPVEISLSPLAIDGHQLVIAVARDVTERRSAEREEQELLLSVTHVLEGITDAIVALDATGRITRANTAAAALFGRLREELVGQAAFDVFHWEDDSGRRLPEKEYVFRQTITARSPVIADSRYFRTLDGRRIPVEISSMRVADSQGRVEMIVQVIRDMTRTREVEELKNQILSLVSHELRTPIGHIKGFASSLLEPDVTWDPATQRDFIHEIDREADRLAALVNGLLDMSRIEGGLALTELTRLSPATVTRRALGEVDWAVREHRVSVDVADDLPDVLANAAHLERLLGNLLENAAKYSEPGSEIHVQARIVESSVQWSVTDQGQGIPADYRERIFEKFVRVPGVGSRKPGIGLGLPICKGIVEAHGGRLWLESPPGGGSRFLFTIPLARSPE
ncbi:MAG TPA: PAS domain S-box protein [Chloroflexota bacterium]